MDTWMWGVIVFEWIVIGVAAIVILVDYLDL